MLSPVRGALAQLVAHNTGSVGVSGSNPLCSTETGSLQIKGFLFYAMETILNWKEFTLSNGFTGVYNAGTGIMQS